MLDAPKGLQQSNSLPQPRSLTGRQLTRRLNRWGKRDRARLAADILAGQVDLVDPTAAQIATLCGVSTTYVAEALGNRKPSLAATLLRSWNRSSDPDRVAFARQAGAEVIFDTIAKAID